MFDPIAAPVDYFEIGGLRSPGVAELDQVAISRLIDERKGFGLMGATTVVKGQELAKFSASITLTTSEDFAAWDAFVSQLRRFDPRADRIRGKSFSHPQTDQLGISAVSVKRIGSPKRTGEDGTWVASIDFVEHRRPRRMLATTDGSDERTPSEDPVDREIARLTGQVQELSQ